MTSQPGKQKIAVHVLPNVSKTKSKSDKKNWSIEKYFSRKIIHKMW